jgi:hypothetical protein
MNFFKKTTDYEASNINSNNLDATQRTQTEISVKCSTVDLSEKMQISETNEV